MASGEIHVNDVGTIFELTVYDTVNDLSVVKNISSASTLTVKFLKQDGTVMTRNGVLTTDGSDGKFQYTTVAGDLDKIGGWRIQGYVVLPSGAWNTDIHDFTVMDNLS